MALLLATIQAHADVHAGNCAAPHSSIPRSVPAGTPSTFSHGESTPNNDSSSGDAPSAQSMAQLRADLLESAILVRWLI